MNKITFTWILECALLSWDRVSKEQMLKEGAGEEEVEIGIKLYNYLKDKEIENKRLETGIKK